MGKYITDPEGFGQFASTTAFKQYVDYVIRPSYELHGQLAGTAVAGEAGRAGYRYQAGARRVRLQRDLLQLPQRTVRIAPHPHPACWPVGEARAHVPMARAQP